MINRGIAGGLPHLRVRNFLPDAARQNACLSRGDDRCAMYPTPARCPCGRGMSRAKTVAPGLNYRLAASGATFDPAASTTSHALYRCSQHTRPLWPVFFFFDHDGCRRRRPAATFDQWVLRRGAPGQGGPAVAAGVGGGGVGTARAGGRPRSTRRPQRGRPPRSLFDARPAGCASRPGGLASAACAKATQLPARARCKCRVRAWYIKVPPPEVRPRARVALLGTGRV